MVIMMYTIVHFLSCRFPTPFVLGYVLDLMESGSSDTHTYSYRYACSFCSFGYRGSVHNLVTDFGVADLAGSEMTSRVILPARIRWRCLSATTNTCITSILTSVI